MTASKRMVLLLQGGLSRKAQLNPALVGALNAFAGECETCLNISREIDANAEGGEYTEASSFPGNSVHKLDAHFKFHWKSDYELVDPAQRRPAQ